MSNIQIRLAEGAERDAAMLVEEQVFREEGYPYDYQQYEAQSRVFGAFDAGRCVGAVRVITSGPLLPPFIHHCKLWDTQMCLELFRAGKLEELGTVAVPDDMQKSGISIELYRAAYQSAVRLGVSHWGIVMESERTEFLNGFIHTTFEQCGDVGFRGWPIPPYIMSLSDFDANLHENDPALHAWTHEG